MYTLRDPVSKTTVGFKTIDEARKFAFTIIERGIQKSVTIKSGDRVYGKVYESSGFMRGVLYKGAGGTRNDWTPYVLGPDGTLFREFDGSW